MFSFFGTLSSGRVFLKLSSELGLDGDLSVLCVVQLAGRRVRVHLNEIERVLMSLGSLFLFQLVKTALLGLSTLNNLLERVFL